LERFALLLNRHLYAIVVVARSTLTATTAAITTTTTIATATLVAITTAASTIAITAITAPSLVAITATRRRNGPRGCGGFTATTITTIAVTALVATLVATTAAGSTIAVTALVATLVATTAAGSTIAVTALVTTAVAIPIASAATLSAFFFGRWCLRFNSCSNACLGLCSSKEAGLALFDDLNFCVGTIDTEQIKRSSLCLIDRTSGRDNPIHGVRFLFLPASVRG